MTFEEDCKHNKGEYVNQDGISYCNICNVIIGYREMITFTKKQFQECYLDQSKVREAMEKLIVYLDYKDIRAVHFESMIYRDIKQRLLGFEKELGLTSEEKE
jgi:hypothetical protein